MLLASGHPAFDSMDVCCSLVASDCDHLCFGAFFRLRKVVNLLVTCEDLVAARRDVGFEFLPDSGQHQCVGCRGPCRGIVDFEALIVAPEEQHADFVVLVLVRKRFIEDQLALLVRR